MSRFVAVTVVGLAIAGINQSATAQFGFAGFTKNKKQPPVLDPRGADHSKSWSLFDLDGDGDGALTFEGPVNAAKKLNQSTQQALSGARDAIAKPFSEIKQARLWPTNPSSAQPSFQIIPDWMKPRTQPEVTQPTTLADWLSQPRPQ